MAMPTASSQLNAPSHSTLHNIHYNVKAYGALGDGSTNDAAAIQAAIDAANSAGGGIVYFPAFTYALASALTPKNNVTLQFAPLATLKLKTNANCFIVYLSGGAATLSDFTISGGIFDANGSNQTAGPSGGIYLGGTITVNRCLIENVRVLNAYGHGIAMEGVGDTTNYKIIRGCSIEGHGIGVIGYGIYVDYAKYAVITQNTVSGGLHSSDAIELGHSGFYRCTHNTIFDNQLQFPFSSDSIIAFNTCVGANSYIVNDSNTADRVRIIGNNIVSAAPSVNAGAISVTGADALILGNYVGITTAGADRGIRNIGANCTIQNNTIITAKTTIQGFGILLDTTAGARVIGNNIRGKWSVGIALCGDDQTVMGNYVEADAGAGIGIQLANSGATGHTNLRNLVEGNNIQVAATAVDFQNQTNASNRIKTNLGYNPQGVAAITVTASPFTYTNNDVVQEAVHIFGGTVTTVVKNAITLFSHGGVAVPGDTVWLEPGEAVTVTYTGAPTMNKDRK